jgi:hypothetical protein
MAGLAMLAIPVSALAHPKDFRDDPRPFAAHDQGWHRGWFKHQAEGPMSPTRPFAYRNDYVPPAAYYNQALRRDEWREDAWRQNAWRRNAWNNGAGYRRGCDADGDDCEGSYNPGYWNNGGGYYHNGGGYAYNEDESPGWYSMAPLTGMGVPQQQAWLIAKRQRVMVAIARLRARGDSRGAQRLVPVVNAFNRRIARLNNGLGYNSGYGYAPANFGYAPTGYGYAPANGYGYAPTGYGYAPGNSLAGLASPLLYGNGAYAGNPTIDALSTLVVPMLTGVR